MKGNDTKQPNCKQTLGRLSLKNTNTIENTNTSGTSNLIDFGGSSVTSQIQPTFQNTSGATSNTTKFNK